MSAFVIQKAFDGHIQNRIQNVLKGALMGWLNMGRKARTHGHSRSSKPG